MRIQEWFGSYLSWLRISPEIRETFDCRKITMIQLIGPNASYDVDGIKILAALIDDNGTTDMDVIEAGIPLNQGHAEIIWESVLPHIVLLAASLEFQEDLSKENLRKAGEIGRKTCLLRDGLSLDPPQTIHVHTSDKYEYWLESKPDLDGKAVICFTVKRRAERRYRHVQCRARDQRHHQHRRDTETGKGGSINGKRP